MKKFKWLCLFPSLMVLGLSISLWGEWKPQRVAIVASDKHTIEAISNLSLPFFGYMGKLLIVGFPEDKEALWTSMAGRPKAVFETRADRSYYLLWIPEDKKKDIPEGVKVVFRDGPNTLIEARPQDVPLLSLLGYGLTRVRFKALPPPPSIGLRMKPKTEGLLEVDPLLQQLANQVSADSLSLYAERLEDFQTRYSYTDSCQSAGDWIYQKFQEFGIPVEFFFYSYEGYTWKNVIATIQGSTNPDQIFVICAHYDCTSEDPWNLAPGADDNGSGTSLVLEAARILSDYTFDGTVKFICFSGEEQGLIGSEAYVEWAEAQGLDFRAVLNMDMVAYVADPPYNSWDINIYCDNNSVALAESLATVVLTYTQGVPYVENTETPFYGSDHYYFALYGNEAIGAIDAWPPWSAPDWDPYYHSTGDLVSTLDFQYSAEVAKAGVVAIATWAGVQPRDSLDPMPPESLSAYSDYTTPSSIHLDWIDPTTTVGGEPLTNLAGILVFLENGALLDTVLPGIEEYDATGLTDGVYYGFYLVAFTTEDSLSLPTPIVYWFCGGDPVPSPPESLQVTLHPIIPRRVHITWLDPTTQRDGTPLDDLLGIRVYDARVETLIQEVPPGVEELTLEMLPHGLWSFYLRAVDNEIPQNESSPTEDVSIAVGPFYREEFEQGPAGWTHEPATPGWGDQWHLETYRNHTPGGNSSWKCGGSGPLDYSNHLDAALLSPELPLSPGAQMMFWHWMEAESSSYYIGEAYDGGIVEISRSGAPWTQISPQEGYPFVTRGSGPFGEGTPCFSGSFDWSQAIFLLEIMAPETANFRLRFGSDDAITREGWYVDDLLIGPLYSPGILLFPESLVTTLSQGERETLLLAMGNQGFLELEFLWDTVLMETWVTVSPSLGSVSPDDTITLQILFDATNLDPGTYRDTLLLSNNDPSRDTILVPVTLNVMGFQVGDANGDGQVDYQDLVYIGSYLFEGGPPPDPFLAGDANGDCTVDSNDLTYLANFLFSGGPPPLLCVRRGTLGPTLKKSSKRRRM